MVTDDDLMSRRRRWTLFELPPISAAIQWKKPSVLVVVLLRKSISIISHHPLRSRHRGHREDLKFKKSLRGRFLKRLRLHHGCSSPVALCDAGECSVMTLSQPRARALGTTAGGSVRRSLAAGDGRCLDCRPSQRQSKGKSTPCSLSSFSESSVPRAQPAWSGKRVVKSCC